MGKLILSEIYKLQKIHSFRMIFLLLFAIGILRGFTPCTGYQACTLGLFPDLFDAVLVSVFTAAFICMECSNRTFGNAVLCGTPRRSVFLAKLAVYFPGPLILLLVPPVESIPVATMRNGFGADWDAVALEIAANFFFYILHRFSMAGFAILTASVIQNPVGTLGISVAGIYLVTLTRNPGGDPAGQGATWIAWILITVLFLSAATFIFVRRDLK